MFEFRSTPVVSLPSGAVVGYLDTRDLSQMLDRLTVAALGQQAPARSNSAAGNAVSRDGKTAPLPWVREESASGAEGKRGAPEDNAQIDVAQIHVAQLDEAQLDEAPIDEAELIDRISVLESIKAAAAAQQARYAVAFDVSRRHAQAQRGVPAHRRGRGVAEQIALARRESPSRGSRHLGLAKALVTEMPCTWRQFATGELSEWRASLVVQATAVLAREDRETVDRELAGQLGGMSDRQLAATARAAAYRIDPMAVATARARAEGDRRVSLRPTPEAMTILTAYLPMTAGIAAFTALDRHARAQRATATSARSVRSRQTPWSSASPGRTAPPGSPSRSVWS